jgi:anthranilate phosphoribosyltransferase
MKTMNLLQSAVEQIKGGGTLNSKQMADAFRIIMRGEARDSLVGALLGILATRVPTGEELHGASEIMKECVEEIVLPNPGSLLDTCGTGGAPKTFNVSTAAGIVSAACGVRVAKHGNRSRTGRGSAEILEQLGINIAITIQQQQRCLEEVGICFCFAPNHHKAVAHVMPVRKDLGFPTIFNLLGPLTNPCSAGRQLLGVWDNSFVLPMAESLLASGTIKSAVVHSEDGLDEISISAPTRIMYINGGGLIDETICPEDIGLQTWGREHVTASSLSSATNMFTDVLIGGAKGAPREMVLINTAVGLLLADKAEDLSQAVLMGAEAIDSGKVASLIQQWINVSNTHTQPTQQ